MEYTLENEFLTVKVSTTGGVLTSIKSKDGLEYLWQGVLITDTLWKASVHKGYRYGVLWGIPLFTDFWIDSVRKSSDRLRQK